MLLDSARALYDLGQYEEAGSLWRTTLTGARVASDSSAEAEALTWVAYVAWQLAEYDEARRLGEEALALKRTYGLESRIARSLNQLGLVAWYQGRLTDAANLFQEAAESGRAIDPNNPMVAVAAGNLGLVHTDLGNFERAREGFSLLRDVGRRLENPRYEGNAHTNLGMLDIVTGRPLAAVANLRRALDLYRPVDFVNGQQVALGQLAAAYADLGEPRLAFITLDTALQLSRRTGQRDEEARNLEQLAHLHHHAGNLKRALLLFERAREVYEEVGLDHETGVNLRNVAALRSDMGDHGSAARDVMRALAVHRDIGDRLEQLHDLNLAAEVEHASGRWDAAQSHLHRARALAEELDVPSIRVAVALTEAEIADRDRDSRRVLEVLDEIDRDLASVGAAAETEALTLRTRAHARLNQMERAAAAGRRGVASVERMRARFGSGQLRTSFVAQRVEVYSELVSVLLRLGLVEEAFEVADAARGRALAEHVAGTGMSGMSGSRGAGAERLRQRISQLVVTLTDMQSWPDDERSPATEAQLDDELRRARARYQAMLVEFEEQESETASLVGARGAPLGDIQPILGEHEALVEYLVGRERVWMFVVRHDRVQAFSTEVPEERLSSRVRVARGFLGDPETPDAVMRAVLQGLHTVLAAPALHAGALSGAQRLLLVPHGVLNYVPFAALQDRVTGEYLVEDYDLQYLPTAAALPVLRGARARTVRASGSVSLFAPLAELLPATRDETAAIRLAVAQAEEFVNGRATEAEFRERLVMGDIVHVATHGVLNVRNPMFSRIELAPGRGAAGFGNDGRLEVHELLSLSIRSPLVFLSGCETGAGGAWRTRFAKGEDYATLAQAFLYAGAGAVVATLWRIDDDGAAHFATRFYDRLGSADVAAALAAAQRESIGNPAYAAPYYWASYRFTGHGGTP